MIKFKKSMTAITLMLFMLLCLVACGNDNGEPSKTSGTESGEQNEEPETESGVDAGNEQATALTLADGEAKLIYAKDNYVVAAFHGPDDDIGAHFCDADGNDHNEFGGYGHPSDGWTLIVSNEFPEGYDYSGIGVSVTDYTAEKGADGRYPSQKYLNIEQMTEEEMKAIGLTFLDGHCCLVTSGRGTYGGNSFGFLYSFSWFDDYCFLTLEEIDESEEFGSRFSYFAGDGTPLEEYFDGYWLDISAGLSGYEVLLVRDGETVGNGHMDEGKHKSMCDELIACKPYVIYTGLDGTEQRFDLLTEQ